MEQAQRVMKVLEAKLPGLGHLPFLPDSSQVHVLGTQGPIFSLYRKRNRPTTTYITHPLFPDTKEINNVIYL